MSTDDPTVPDFRMIAEAVIEETSSAPRGGPLSADPAQIIARHLEACWVSGTHSLQAQRHFEQPEGSLVFRSARRADGGPERKWLVMADEEPTDDGFPPWLPFQMTFGDRALMRALATEMLQRLDALEELQAAEQQRQRAAREGDQ